MDGIDWGYWSRGGGILDGVWEGFDELISRRSGLAAEVVVDHIIDHN